MYITERLMIIIRIPETTLSYSYLKQIDKNIFGNRAFSNQVFFKKNKKQHRCFSFITHWTSGKGRNLTGTCFIFAAVVYLLHFSFNCLIEFPESFFSSGFVWGFCSREQNFVKSIARANCIMFSKQSTTMAQKRTSTLQKTSTCN